MSEQPVLTTSKGARVAVVDGIRTPFIKKNTLFKEARAKDLGTMVANELLSRLAVPKDKIEQVVFGQVIQDPDIPNLSREISLLLNMPKAQSYTVSSSCPTGLQVLINLSNSILMGNAHYALAGGADSLSNAPIRLNSHLIQLFRDVMAAKSYEEKYRLLRQITWQDFKLQALNLKDPLTQLSLSAVSEQMAQDFHLSRQELDEYAARSHRLAYQAWQSGELRQQVMVSFPPPYKDFVVSDNQIEKHVKPEFYQKFKPFNGKNYGTATDWNTSHSCDGAAAVLLMNEHTAKAEGLNILGYIRHYTMTANDVWKNMFVGVTYSIAKVLQNANMRLSDLDLIDIHETSAAQILSNLKLIESETFARQHLNRSAAIGQVDMSKLNILGGSLAYGNPRAVSSLRLIIQSLYALKQRGGGRSLIASSGLGGIGGAMILESE